jgi:PAS domain S-box-containing protein
MGLNNILLLTNSSHDVEQIRHQIVEESCKALGCESARIAMREGESWVIRYVNRLPDDLIGRSFSDEELPLAALAIVTKKPVAIDDAFRDERANTELMKSLGMRSVLVVPLTEEGVVTGTLLFGYHSAAVSFTDTEIDYAGRVATGVEIALHNARMYQDLQRTGAEMEEAKKLGDALNEIDTILYSTQDFEVIMKKMLQLATEAIGAETAMIFSREGDRWVTRYVYKLSSSLVGRSFSNSEVLHTAITAGTKRSIVVSDTLHSQDVDQQFVRMLGIRSLLDFPLIIQGEVIGDLTFHYHSDAIPFNERQVEFVRKLQNSISLALATGRLREAAQKSESRLKEAEKLGKFGYFYYDLRTRKVTWSEGMFHIFGRERDLGAPTVEEFFALYAVDPGMDVILECLEKEETSEFDATVKRNDNLLNLHITTRSLKDVNGNALERFGTVQDITERKRAEEVLRFSEARYRALYNYNPTMLATVDADLTMLSANSIFAGLLGYTADELEGQSLLKIFHEDDRPSVAEQLQKSLENPHQVYRWQYRKIHKDGHLVWVDEMAQAVYDLNGALNVLVTCQDITERKRTEEERVKLLMQLEAVLNSINEGVVISDLEGNVLTMNKEALALYGFESIEQVRRHLSEYQKIFELFDPEGRAVPLEAWPLARALRGERFVDYEVQVRRKDNGKSWLVTTNGTPVFNTAGESILAVITLRDITERKQMEAQVKRLNADLAERAGELEEANRELESFNYTVAHDLRKPLTVINGYCQVLKEMCSDTLGVQCKGYLKEAYEGTLHMNRLIDALLNFSRMAHAEPKRERVDLLRICEEVAVELKLAEPERQVTFRIPRGIVAEADPDLLRVVIGNLFGNAWKFTSTREEAVIEFGAKESDGKRTYFIRDNGIGFEPAEADKLFAPFQRLERGEDVGGLGIGLATVDRIIKRHGGKVWAEGEPGKGATFYFTLGED